jgi:hypothetical protein
MSQFLDFRRLYQLLYKNWFENRKAYGLFFLTVAAFFIGWFIFILMIGNPYAFATYNQVTLYFGGLFIAGCLSASFIFGDFVTRPRKIHYHLLPAATLEKLLCVLFYGVLIFFVGYTLIFYVTDYLAIKMANNANYGTMMAHTAKAIEWKQRFGITEPLSPATPINVFSRSADLFIFYPGDNIDLFTAFFPIQSAFILGSVYFNKNSFFKTLAVLLLIWLFFFVLEDKLLFPLLPRNSSTSNVFTASVITENTGNETYYTLPFWIGRLMTFLMRFGITPAIWLATYYRLKEKEI